MTVATDQPQTHAQRLAPLEAWHFWFDGRDELVKRQLSAYGSESPIVDVGCGTANFAHQLAHVGYDAYAMDFVAPPASSGREIAGDAARMPMGTGSVATVLVRDVLEHLDDAAMLTECRRILKPGGLLVALVPA